MGYYTEKDLEQKQEVTAKDIIEKNKRLMD